MVNETRKILHNGSIRISATCVRVPIPVAHGVSIQAEFEKPVSVSRAREVLSAYPGIKVLDDPAHHVYPVSTIARGTDDVYVGRIRKDLAVDNGLLLYTCADNVRKGAASNAVQIVKAIIVREGK
jgi:aspartate-semialdehyde dehydrogenase